MKKLFILLASIALVSFSAVSQKTGGKTDYKETEKYKSNQEPPVDLVKKAQDEENSLKFFMPTTFFSAVDEIVYIKLKTGEVKKGFFVGYIAESVMKFVAQNYSGLAYSNETKRKDQKTISFLFEEIDEVYMPVVYDKGYSPKIKVPNPMINPDDKNLDFVYHKNILAKTKSGEKEVFVMLMNPTFNQKYDVYFSQNTMIKDGMPRKLYVKTGAEITELSSGDYEEFFNKTFAECPRIFNTKKYLKDWGYFAEHTYRFSKDQCTEQKK